MSELSDDFRKGAKAMFDVISYRAANNYHGNPRINAQCDEENKIALAWATDALQEISPEDCFEWRSIVELGEQVAQLQKYERAVKQHNDECDRLCAGASTCGYKQYFDNTGRRCPNCPVYSKVEVE